MANTASPYIPSFIKAALENSKPVTLTFDNVKQTNIANSSSFMYDASNAPLKNTQQLNVDWSRFENHTFFSSAETKVNLAFDQIINGFPFDGTRSEVESFFENLTGYDRWLFNQFPRFQGQLYFSGGSYVSVKDHAGALYPDISRNNTGDSIINPKGTSFTIEAQVYVPDVVNDVQTIVQKVSSSMMGLTLSLSSSNVSTVNSLFAVTSGSSSMYVTAPLTKGAFNHVCVTWNRETNVNHLEFYVDNVLVNTSSNSIVMGDLDIDASDLIIGSGSSLVMGSTQFTPVQTFNGALDELRIFHSLRTTKQQEAYSQKSLYATSDLKLYYRFNEPPPPLTPIDSDSTNAIVLDSSGNSLHAIINNFTGTLRQDASLDATNPMIYEKLETCPVLFPAHPDVVALNVDLMASASLYDKANPNLITRLIPEHYLLEGSAADGTGDEFDVDKVSSYGGSGIPGQGEMNSSQIIASFLFIWARFFDEMKLYIDSFPSLKYVDYQKDDNVPDNFLYNLVSLYGFNLPPLFNDTTIEQYVDAENIDNGYTSATMALKAVQNEMLRRVLVNMPDVIKSKGTQHAIKSFLRSMGIDPDNSMKIREYGGPTTKQLSFAREVKSDSSAMVEFTTSSFATSPFLTASRIEVGYPTPAGTMVSQSLYPPHGISNNLNDGMLTSGSWTCEGIYKYTPLNVQAMTSPTQSLLRLCEVQTTASAPWAASESQYVIANLLAMSSSIDPKIVLYVRPGVSSSSPLLRMEVQIPTGSFFDYSRWNVSFGCQRNDSFDSIVSSSYFLRVATENNGTITWSTSTGSLFYETPSGEANAWRQGLTNTNHFLAIGKGQTIANSGTGVVFLHDASMVPPEARVTTFDGRVSNVRFWSRATTQLEFDEHVRNYKSLGVVDPSLNYNFVTTRSGSFEKIRLDAFTKQLDRGADALGNITFIDFSQNNMHLSGSGFYVDKPCVLGEIFDHSYLSPYFDEAATDEKIRVRGYQNQTLIDATPWASAAPVHEIVKSESPTDDTRLSIEFSLIDALNRDIVTLFATFDELDNALGSPELMYSPDYPDLQTLRDIYFHRIKEKLNFQNFFEFFNWFDKSLGTFIEQLIPRKTAFKGTNFVVESHMLERHKLEYTTSEQYVDEIDRSMPRDTILVQQIVGTARKY